MVSGCRRGSGGVGASVDSTYRIATRGNRNSERKAIPQMPVVEERVQHRVDPQRHAADVQGDRQDGHERCEVHG
jgi:hypothetical protein